MNAPSPQNDSDRNPGQNEPRTATLEGAPVSASSLRDTEVGGAAQPKGGSMKFSFASGSRPLEGYTLKRGVGRGGFGEVYFATSDAGKEVALKCIRRNLEIELRGVSQCLNLKHPNLVSLFDIKQDDQENFWIVMEFVAGEGLEQIIARHPNGLPDDQVLGCIRHISGGVAYLHDRGIVHRDLKPGNIFLDEGTFKIGDYGLSKFISHSRRSGQTESIGTVHYMAPEIANGRYGKEIDIYALGIIFYEMLTGHVPYEGESLGEVLMKHLTAEPDLRGIAEPYRTVVARLLHKDPDARYSSVQAMLADLDAGLAGQPMSAQPASAAVAPACSQPAAEPKAAPEHVGLTPRRSPDPVAANKPTRLMLSTGDAVAQGVCGGFARYFGIDPLWIRLTVFTATFFFLPLAFVYLLLTWLMPSDEEEVPASLSAGASSDWDPRPFFIGLGRFVLALMLGVSVGLLSGGMTVTTLGWRYEAPTLIGLSGGFLTAAATAWVLLQSYRSSVVRVLIALLLGAGAGFSTAAAVLFTGGFDYVAALFGTGVGFLTAGLAICLIQSFSRLWWRALPPLCFGLAAGLLTGGATVIQLGSHSDAPMALGFGAGLLACVATAWLLFFGPLAISNVTTAGDSLRATNVWSDDSSVDAPPVGIPAASKVLIVLAVALAAIPIALHLVSRQAFTDGPGPTRTLGLATFGSHHRCDEPSCGRSATVLVSAEYSYAGSGSFQTKNYCDVHARKAAWEATQSRRKVATFDIETGKTRHDLDGTQTTEPEKKP